MAQKHSVSLYLLVMPIRLAWGLLIFTPILLLLKGLTALGEFIHDTCDHFDFRWSRINDEIQFLTNGIQREQAIEALQKVRNLEQQLQAYRDTRKP